MSNSEQLRRSWSANADAWSAAVREQKIESRRLATNAAIVDAVMACLSGTTGSQPVERGRVLDLDGLNLTPEARPLTRSGA